MVDTVALRTRRVSHWHDTQVRALAVAPNDATAAVGCEDEGLYLVDLPAGNIMRRLDVRRLRALRYDPEGTRLAVGDSLGILRIWSADLEKLLWSAQHRSREITCIAFSPSGKLLAYADTGDVVTLCDSVTGELVKTILSDPGDVRSLSISMDDRTLAVGYEAPGRVELYHLRTGGKLLSLPEPDTYFEVLRFSPTAHELFFGGWTRIGESGRTFLRRLSSSTPLHITPTAAP